MYYFVYLIAAENNKKIISYVGYTNNLRNRLDKHNSNKGARSTKGFKWVLIYKKKFISKSKAMSYEYKLKKSRKKRNEIVEKYK